MTTYADMVTNLMALFVLLYAFSELDAQRFQAVITAFQARAGIFTGSETLGEIGIDPAPALAPDRNELMRMLRDFVSQEGLMGAVQVIPSQEGITLSFIDKVLFDSGKAALREDSIRILGRLGNLLAQLPNAIRVEGHTDNVPIRNAQFPSNWELSVYRASTVVRFMEDRSGIGSKRLSAVGYGEYRPVLSNTTAANRRRNRRVDIIILVDNETSPEADSTS